LTGSPKLKVASWIHLDAAKELATSAGMDLDKMMTDARSRDFHPVALPVKLQAHMVSQVRPFESNNVVAMLPGSDAKTEIRSSDVHRTLRSSGHPSRYGGGTTSTTAADDNATGCGILIELAHAFSGATAQTAALHYCCVRDGGKEQGTAGLRVSRQHPPIPAGKITLDLNYDDIPRSALRKKWKSQGRSELPLSSRPGAGGGVPGW